MKDPKHDPDPDPEPKTFLKADKKHSGSTTLFYTGHKSSSRYGSMGSEGF